ncbi:MAG: FHA domain-containing protein [Myxococcales bacterium]|nr:FHA domain-containing protein [Myxococcales bacterium]
MKRAGMACGLVVCAMASWQQGPWGRAFADPPSVRPPVVLDALRIEPSPLPGRAMLQLLVRAVDATGNPRAIATASGGGGWRLIMGQRELDVPVVISRASAADVETALALVISTSPDFGTVLPLIAHALDEEILAALRKDDRVAVLTYATTIGGTSRMATVAGAKAALQAIAPDEEAASPAFADAVERAIAAVERYRSDRPGVLVRRVVIVVSDGIDGALDRDRITALGVRAARKGVRLFAVAYAPTGSKEPLLNLGELAKQSLGTLRWVRTDAAQAFREQMSRLAAELAEAYVLTAFVLPPAGAADVRALAIIGDAEVKTNELAWRAPSCGVTCTLIEGACSDTACMAAPVTRPLAAQLWRLAPYPLGAVLVLALLLAWRRTGTKRRGGAPLPQQTWVCLRGPTPGATAKVSVGDVLGKHRGCRVTIADPSVSDQHAEIRVDREGNWVIRDLGSTNGTFIGGVRVTQGTLRLGTIVGLGATQWRVMAQT